MSYLDRPYMKLSDDDAEHVDAVKDLVGDLTDKDTIALVLSASARVLTMDRENDVRPGRRERLLPPNTLNASSQLPPGSTGSGLPAEEGESS